MADASNNVFGVVACESLVSMYKSAMDKINEVLSLADGPRKLLRDIQTMLDYPFEKANRLVGNVLSAIQNADKLLGDLMGLDLSKLSNIQKILDGIKSLTKCPLIGDIPGIQAISALLDQSMLSDVPTSILKGILDNIVSQVRSSITDRVTNVLNQYKGLVDNSISDMISKYTGKLDIIKDPLKTLDQLKKCLETVCSTYKAAGQFVTGDVPDLFDQLKCKFDDSGNLVSTISEKATKKVVEASDEVKKNLTELETSAEEFYKKWMPKSSETEGG